FAGYVKIVAGISLANLVLALGFIVVIGFVLSDLQAKLPKLLIILCGICFAFFWYRILLDATHWRWALETYLFPVGLLLTVAYLYANTRDARFPMLALVTSVAISAFVAILQDLDVDWAWRLRTIVPSPPD